MISMDQIRPVIEAYPPDRRYALAIMQDLQQHFNHVPRVSMEMIAAHIGSTVAQLYSMATFYRALSLKPKGKNIIKLCDGTACHIRGANNLIGGITRELGITPGETSEDGLFSLELVNCLGSCALAPVMVVGGQYYGKVTLDKLPEILAQYQEAIV